MNLVFQGWKAHDARQLRESPPHVTSMHDRYIFSPRQLPSTTSQIGFENGIMATPTSSSNNIHTIAENGSDYGSDLDETTALDLLSQAESQPLRDVVLDSIEDPLLKDDGVEQQAHLRLSRWQCSPDVLPPENKTPEGGHHIREASVEVEYDEANRTTFHRACEKDRSSSLALT